MYPCCLQCTDTLGTCMFPQTRSGSKLSTIIISGEFPAILNFWKIYNQCSIFWSSVFWHIPTWTWRAIVTNRTTVLPCTPHGTFPNHANRSFLFWWWVVLVWITSQLNYSRKCSTNPVYQNDFGWTSPRWAHKCCPEPLSLLTIPTCLLWLVLLVTMCHTSTPLFAPLKH